MVTPLKSEKEILIHPRNNSFEERKKKTPTPYS
jgi:hypothetical protein